MPLKNEKGARFQLEVPSCELSVKTHAMGRGIIVCVNRA